MYPDNRSLKYFGKYLLMSVKPLWWLNTLGLIKVDLIHKVGHNNMVLDVLSEREEFQAMSTIHILVANVYW